MIKHCVFNAIHSHNEKTYNASMQEMYLSRDIICTRVIINLVCSFINGIKVGGYMNVTTHHLVPLYFVHLIDQSFVCSKLKYMHNSSHSLKIVCISNIRFEHKILLVLCFEFVNSLKILLFRLLWKTMIYV